MEIQIQTPVMQSYEQVWQGFTRELFLALAPPLTPIHLLRFDGCKKGDEVHLEIDFGVFSQLWCSKIVEQTTTNDEIYFIDEGIQLPFFLSKWKHKHRIVKQATGALIIDEIEFEGKFFTSAFIYPVLLLQFMYRQPVYQKWFEEEYPIY